jgi:D-amino peptidase
MPFCRTLVATFAAVAISIPVLAQPRQIKVLVLYDMEGVSGATEYAHTTFAHPEQYAAGRKALTADVNAAIAGLKAGGATEIVVADGHGSGNSQEPDVFESQLLSPARMIARERAFDIYMDSYDQSFDAIVAIAMHAGAGNRAGFLSHTYTFEDSEYKVNGVPFNETMILAMGAARLKIPLVMVSGDDQFEKEVRRNLPWVKHATVKHAVSRARAEAFAPDEVARRIEAAAREAIQQLDAARLPDLAGPFRFALTFQDEAQARNASLLPGAEVLANPSVVQIRAGDFEEGYRQSLRLIELAGLVGTLTATRRVLAAQPNAAALRLGVIDWEYDRWLDRLAATPATPPAALPTRYWGAR